MLKGLFISLTAVEQADLKQLMDWRNTPELRRYFREYRELNTTAQKQWFEDKVLSDSATIMFSIRRLDDNILLGSCGLVYIDWIRRHAELSLYIGWNNAYIDDEGFAEEACRLLLKYAYHELCLNKVWTEIYSFDTPKKNLYDKLGFHKDGVLRQNHYSEGKWVDSLIFSLLASEFNNFQERGQFPRS